MPTLVSGLMSLRKSRRDYVTFGIIELALAYALVSRAIDTGSLWQYGLGVLLAIGAIQNFVKAVRFKGNDKK
jgi:hypothetical protein